MKRKNCTKTHKWSRWHRTAFYANVDIFGGSSKYSHATEPFWYTTQYCMHSDFNWIRPYIICQLEIAKQLHNFRDNFGMNCDESHMTFTVIPFYQFHPIHYSNWEWGRTQFSVVSNILLLLLLVPQQDTRKFLIN